MSASTGAQLSPSGVVFLVLASLVLSVSCVNSAPSVAASVSVTVDVSTSRHSVSAAIYGTNFFGGIASSPAFTSGWVGSTRMGGGDPTTAYNWRLDADNAGFDWFFQQRPRAPLGNNSADFFVASSVAVGATAVVDISSIGMVAAGRDDCYSFPISTFPDQQRHNGDMGNGLLPNGTSLGSVYGPQLQCYTQSVPQDAVDFVAHLRQLVGNDTFEQSAIVQLDNEPEWWLEHRSTMHSHRTLRLAHSAQLASSLVPVRVRARQGRSARGHPPAAVPLRRGVEHDARLGGRHQSELSECESDGRRGGRMVAAHTGHAHS